jgi:23S rRNA pseudouridine1911/1915/1917 synthase
MHHNPEILYEDQYLVAFDKPSGMVVNRSHTYAGFTLQDFIEAEDPKKFSDIDDHDEEEESDYESRSGIVHRLDKDTSGIILTAKDPDTFLNLQIQFKQREITKQYLAIVLGTINEQKIEIDAPIKRHPKFPFKFAVSEEGRESYTVIEKVQNIEKEGNSFTSIRVFPKTGRTHQIRVHLSALNHCIAGDEIYCTRNQLITSQKYFTRLMLHAFSISFIHPKTGGNIILESPVPQEFTPYF